MNNFSIVIPTYTGQEHIGSCFKSILSQKSVSIKFDVIVIIDGPNRELKDIVESYEKIFQNKGIDFSYYQFSKNQGRFVARQKGAELAKYSRLLFIDDRVTLSDNFLNRLANEKEIMIPNVLEAEHHNFISRLLYLMRKKIYGKAIWGSNFSDYYITTENFESSPKGTTSLWVEKKVFIEACNKAIDQASNLKIVNDDTRLLADMIQQKGRLLRRGDMVIYYHPRTSFNSEIHHLYERGPRFIDYYFKRGTRFWWPIMTCIFVFLAITAAIIVNPNSVLYLLVVMIITDILLSIFLAEVVMDFVMNLVTLPIVVVFFGAGVIKGIFIKIFKRP